MLGFIWVLSVLFQLGEQKPCYAFQVWRVLIQELETYRIHGKAGGATVRKTFSENLSLVVGACREALVTLKTALEALMGDLSLQCWNCLLLMVLSLKKPPLTITAPMSPDATRGFLKSSLSPLRVLHICLCVSVLPLPPENNCDDNCDSDRL